MDREFHGAGFDCMILPVDLRNREEVVHLAAKVKERYGALDFLINNIERGGMPVVHGDYDLPGNRHQWNLELETTLNSKWLLFHYLFDLMRHRSGGSVVNLSSIAALTGRSGPAAVFFNDGYSAANRAIQSFTETWAREAAPAIRVNELMLGFIRGRHGEGTRGWEILTEREKNDLQAGILLDRTGTPEEVAEAVYFLAVEASYITGATLRMDGGFLLGGSRVPPLPPGVLA
jgi:3-oxoacyl-[acyl-carrier protein] reductase